MDPFKDKDYDADWGILRSVCPECAGIEEYHWPECSQREQDYDWEIETDQDFDFEVDF